MSVLVFTENWDGQFKKSSFEIVAYASAIAAKLNTVAIALSIGKVDDSQLKTLAAYGVSKIIKIENDKLNFLNSQAYTSAIEQVAAKENSNVIVLSHNNTGKSIAPRLSVKMKAGLVTGVAGLPTNFEPFALLKKVYTGKALSNVVIKSAVKILTLSQNSFGIIESPKDASIEAFTPTLNDKDFSITIKDVNKVNGKILLNDAEVVISGGRGMKGPENWNIIEELAGILGAATACSRPVSDEGWRPHGEHVGQTGKIIAPNLYIACGISGAIQHVGGINSSKCIVAINKDKDAPIFEVADYGIVGDVNKVLPEMTKAIKEIKGLN